LQTLPHTGDIFGEQVRAKKGNVDPVLELAEKTLPVLEKIDDTDLRRLKEEIRAIVFPDRSQARKEAANDESDLHHLAYCIQNNKSGFLTQEKALLRARHALRSKYGLPMNGSRTMLPRSEQSRRASATRETGLGVGWLASSCRVLPDTELAPA